jgi:hypothetical protein
MLCWQHQKLLKAFKDRDRDRGRDRGRDRDRDRDLPLTLGLQMDPFIITLNPLPAWPLPPGQMLGQGQGQGRGLSQPLPRPAQLLQLLQLLPPSHTRLCSVSHQVRSKLHTSHTRPTHVVFTLLYTLSTHFFCTFFQVHTLRFLHLSSVDPIPYFHSKFGNGPTSQLSRVPGPFQSISGLWHQGHGRCWCHAAA